MAYQTLLLDIRDGIAFLTINRPDKLNALNDQVVSELHAAALALASDRSVRGVIVTGAGPKAFIAGADIGDLAKQGVLDGRRRALTGQQMLLAFERMGKPVLAAVNGFALGGGCELAMMCDLTIAADDALFGEPEIRFSNVGPALIMPFVIGLKRAREMLYLGDPIDAHTALHYGMVNRVVTRAELEGATLKFARRLALISPEALASTKLAINRGADAAGFRNAIRAGLDVLAPLYAARTEVGMKFDEIREKEGLVAALRWRAAQLAE